VGPERAAERAEPGRHRARQVVVVALALVATGVVPAHAAVAPVPVPIVDCVIVGEDGSFRGVFGYSYEGSTSTTVGRGAMNYLIPSSIDGSQPTKFQPGTHDGAFVTPSLSKTQKATWSLDGASVTATWQKASTCGGDVTLPTEGNGIGPVLVLAASVVFSMLMDTARRWRRRLKRS